jgi:pyruvate kinase
MRAMWNARYPQVWFTFGPETKDLDVLVRLFEAGATGARLTFSYGTPELQAERARLVRSAAQQAGKQPFLVADLQGEKCRFATIDGVDEIPVGAGDVIVLTRGTIDLLGRPMRVPVQVPRYLDTLKPNDLVIEGDGALALTVLGPNDDGIECAVQRSGSLHPGRGLIVQAADFRPATLTPKDESDLAAIAHNPDFDALALSFVAGPVDVIKTRQFLTASGSHIPIIAKIETRLGLENLEEIAMVADALMAARGDLALTMPWLDLPRSVERIRDAAREANKPWIIATQLVEGLERFIFPTRAEICDLARWMDEGAYGAMTSYETAFGPRPIAAIDAVTAVVQRHRASAMIERYGS